MWGARRGPSIRMSRSSRITHIDALISGSKNAIVIKMPNITGSKRLVQTTFVKNHRTSALIRFTLSGNTPC